MNRRSAGLVVGVLALVCTVMVLSVVFPLSTAEPHDRYGDDAFAAPESSSFTYEVTYALDGDRVHRERGVAAADGGRYWRTVGDEVESESYQASPEADVYRRTVYEDETEFEFASDRATDDDSTTVLRATADADPPTLFVRENGTDDQADSMVDVIDMYLGILSNTAYDRADGSSDEETGDSGTVVYEPRADWYETTDVYRVTDASGTVVVDESLGGVTSADVAWTSTEPADTYAHYAYATIVEGDRESHEFSFEFDAGNESVREPDWVDDVREEE